MAINQISVFLENKPGSLKRMTGTLAKNEVDMRTLSLAETKDFGIVRLIVDDVLNATTGVYVCVPRIKEHQSRLYDFPGE